VRGNEERGARGEEQGDGWNEATAKATYYI